MLRSRRVRRRRVRKHAGQSWRTHSCVQRSHSCERASVFVHPSGVRGPRLRVRSISIAPGATQFTGDTVGRNSTAATLVNISIPPWLTVNAARLGNGILLHPEPMVTIRPPPV